MQKFSVEDKEFGKLSFQGTLNSVQPRIGERGENW